MEQNKLRQLSYLFEHLDLACLALEEIAEDMIDKVCDVGQPAELKEGESEIEHNLILIAAENLGNEVLYALKELLERNGIEAIRTGIDCYQSSDEVDCSR